MLFFFVPCFAFPSVIGNENGNGNGKELYI